MAAKLTLLMIAVFVSITVARKRKPSYCCGTEFGCCWDKTPRMDKVGSNCPPCKDQIDTSECEKYQNLCNEKNFRGYMRQKYCPKTCGVCTKDICGSNCRPCKDLRGGCEKRQKYCNQKGYRGKVMSNYCAETCGTCSKDCSTTLSDSVECEHYAALGFCKIEGRMAGICPGTCEARCGQFRNEGYCEDVPKIMKKICSGTCPLTKKPKKDPNNLSYCEELKRNGDCKHNKMEMDHYCEGTCLSGPKKCEKYKEIYKCDVLSSEMISVCPKTCKSHCDRYKAMGHCWDLRWLMEALCGWDACEETTTSIGYDTLFPSIK